MPLEIERKFLVRDASWRNDADAGRELQQAYLSDAGRASVRVRIQDGRKAALTIKSSEGGMSRQEFEYEIPLADARELMELRSSALLSKRRYHVAHGRRRWEVDVYSGDNAGLVLAEAELASADEQLELPPWLDREVTGDRRYYASRLARTPFCSWTDANNGEA